METAFLHATSHIQDRSTPFEKNIVTEFKNINIKTGLDLLKSICELVSNNNSQSTQNISKLLGVENKKYKRDERGSKFLIPKNENLSHIAINPDLDDYENDKPITFLSFSGKNLNIKLKNLTELFPNFELTQNTYDGGIQLFFHPVDSRFDFNAVSCQIFTEYKTIEEINELNINSFALLFEPNRIKTRAGYMMTKKTV
jgi:hypothetical protein